MSKQLIIACTSAHGEVYDRRRDGVLNTWAQEALHHPDIDFYFVLGDPGLKLPKRDGMYLKVPCLDNYDSLPDKTRWLCAYALAAGPFDRLFKCDDDAYVCVPRLFEAAATAQGSVVGMSDAGHYHGGAGYLVNRTAALVLAMELDRGIGSGWCSRPLEDQDGLIALQRRGLTYRHDSRFHAWNNLQVEPHNKQITCHYMRPAAMRVCYDRLRWSHLADSASIPKAFHFVWLGDELPVRHEEYINAWARLHPAWQTFLWRDQDIAGHLWTNLAEIKAAKTPAQKSQLLRWEILYRYGGVYVDCDVKPLRPIDQLCEACPGFIGAEDDNAFCPAVIGCVPSDPFCKLVIDSLRDNFDPNNTNLPAVSGSYFVTPLVITQGHNWRTFGKHVFYPKHWSGEVTGLEHAFAEHQWECSWNVKT